MLPRRRLGLLKCLAAFAALAASTGWMSSVHAQDCLSMDPADWPPPAKPYFMLMVDTSGSMAACTNPATSWPETCDDYGGGIDNSCGWQPLRVNDAKCALDNTINAFGGQVNFGLATFTSSVTNCPSTCNLGEWFVNPWWYRYAWDGCDLGQGTQCDGARIAVPMLIDSDPPPASNWASLLQYTDHDCAGDNMELFALGATPLAASLTDLRTYLQSGFGGHASPLTADDPDCRSLNVILLTDGGESCSTDAAAVTAAQSLYNGFTKDSIFRRIYTHVIAFNVDDPGDQTLLDDMHKMGQCGATSGTCASNAWAYVAANEVQLAQDLATIISSAIRPEECNNADDNCNGCVDEGYKHYCNLRTSPDCCDWSSDAERDTCLSQYEASIQSLPPDGDLTLLPCTSSGQQQDEDYWLCYDPGEDCNDIDDNCQDGVDEGVTKCGNPEQCPTTEICDGQDNDCDGWIDEGDVCDGCVVMTEVCNGCDDDCNGVADDGAFGSLDCGLPQPPNCQGTMTCDAPQAVPNPGDCISGAGWGPCTNFPAPETCDGIDNDCNGVADDGLTPGTCVPSGHPAGLDYGANTPCEMGTEVCLGAAGWDCQGGVGPGVEICDDVDNDCNGVADDGTLPGVGNPCGSNIPPCSPGATVCQGGALVCQGGVTPQPEVCDGIDNDCDATIDDAPLADAPQPGQTGCWNEPGSCCTHENFQWCYPPGASCYDAGALQSPCNQGALTCDGLNGWICVGPVVPGEELCDGVDNDCNGTVDQTDPPGGLLPGEGAVCGTDEGECESDLLVCVGGALDCPNDVGPAAEICDGLDNDCDGDIDNGIPVGNPCTPDYDTGLYPGDRPASPCQPGVLQCDGLGGWTCTGGQGPQPEVCDGVDNDCDGDVDEVGAAPDGLDGTLNPYPPPDASIGEVCGESEGQCEPGNWGCLNGLFACLGAVGPTDEQCDCIDNDCDGSVDELPGPDEPALCSPDKDCINSSDACLCAGPCGGGEYPCPSGQECVTATVSGTGEQGSYCVPDWELICGDCASKTVTDANNDVVCAPTGTDPPGCLLTPQCVCQGQAGCQRPCFNVQCSAGLVCSNFGPTPGECVQDTCYLTGCPGCDSACHSGACVDNPCQADSCPADEVCKPNADFTDFTCVGSCAEVDCDPGTECVDGDCVPSCQPPCPDGEVCDLAVPECVTDQCAGAGGAGPCADGACCDPLTGDCGDCPCEGVVCPDGQDCEDGQCVSGSGGSGGGGGAGGGATGGGAVGGSGTGAQGAGSQTPEDDFIWRLSTGGGGCLCEVGPVPSSQGHWRWLGLLGLMLVMRGRRRDATRLGGGSQEVL